MLTPRKIRENDNQLVVLIRLFNFINYTNELKQKVENALESDTPPFKEENFNLAYPFEQKQG